MAATDAVEIVPLGPADAGAAISLSDEAGWNQSEADWAMMARLGHMIGIRGPDGLPVASALALPLGETVGWISMVLVTEAWRRRGLATRLVEECARWLEARGLAPVLDATPAGEQVYARMGFERRLGLTRWQRASTPGGPAAAAGTRDAAPADLPWIAELDRTVSGLDRREILGDLLARRGAAGIAAPDRESVLLGRAGRRATQIGPLTAAREETAIRLLDAALARVPGPVFIDAFDDQPGFSAHLRQQGFEIQRPFARMVRGGVPLNGDPARAFAAAGPELG